jgi:hypothetical protein
MPRHNIGRKCDFFANSTLPEKYFKILVLVKVCTITIIKIRKHIVTIKDKEVMCEIAISNGKKANQLNFVKKKDKL